MQSVVFDGFFQGVASVEKGDGRWQAWRLPHEQAALFPSPDDSLMTNASKGSGVRLRFETDSQNIRIETEPLDAVDNDPHPHFDVTIDGDLVATGTAGKGDESVLIEGIPAGTKVVELWLPQSIPLVITAVLIDDGCQANAVEDNRKKWITYGSSLTHCVRAHSPSRTWPALVARKHNLNLTSLGFGGQCHLDPMVGMTIRDMPADLISLKLGINCMGTLSARTYPANIIGLVRIIREKHPATPIALVSPIASPPRETTPSATGITLCKMRELMKDAHSRLVEMGDENLYYFDGLTVFNEEETTQYAPDDLCHPDADGIELMAQNFSRNIMQSLPL
jgi:GDSL-like lipase/acylhydrolase family protein/salicyl acyltransferaes SsfX3-like protein